MNKCNHFSGKVVMALAAVLAVLAGALGGAPVGGDATEKAVKAFVEGCRVGDAVREGKLEIIPVEASAGAYAGRVLTLDEALQAKELVVEEVDRSGSVNTLKVVNTSKFAVFIMAGEILAGAKQNRILQVDVLLPPGRGAVNVQAFCVEHGRWSAKSEHFYSENNAAPISVRKVAQQEKAQGQVWHEVDCNNVAVDGVSSTGSLSYSFKTKPVQEVKTSLLSTFKDFPRRFPRATGVVVRIDGKILAADLFAQRHLFESLWDKMLESYLVEVARRSREAGVVGAGGSARAFLDHATRARVDLDPSPAGGERTVELFAPGITGSGVLAGGSPLHLALFPDDGKSERAKPPSSPLQRQYNQNESPVQQQLNTPPAVAAPSPRNR